MSQSVDALLAALSTREPTQPAVVTAPGPVVAEPSTAQPSAGGATDVALTHYRRVLAALQRGDWSTFGTEMDALRKTLEDAEAAGPPS